MRAVHALADGVSRAELEQACERLVMRDLLVRGDGATVRFRHGLVREVAYASLAKAARARLHERHAAWLERLGAELPEADAVIGLHLEAACRYEQEVDRRHARAPGVRGGPPARRGGAGGALARRPHRGVGFLERAVALLGADRPEGIELYPPLSRR